MNKYRWAISSIFLLISVLNLFSQSKNQVDISNSNDCIYAKRIKGIGVFSTTNAPCGYGHILEFSNNSKNSLYYIEKEHNTVWYKFKNTEDAELAFDIIPLQKTDDYDFMLFLCNDSNSCEDIRTKKIKPIRTNISRNDSVYLGKTGLSFSSDIDYVHSGPGKHYSSPIKVKPGDWIYLVVDNVYENGKGHKIQFRYFKQYEINGKTVDQITNKPIEAVVLWEDKEGKTLAKVKSDSITGEYSMLVPVEYKSTDPQYILSFVSKSNYFFSDTLIHAKKLIEKKQLSFIGKLFKIIKGKSYKINNMNFSGGSDQLLSSAKPSLEKLLRILKSNNNLKISIEGHVNDPLGDYLNDDQSLSERRAKAVFNYLVKKGINPNRMQTIGFGSKNMLHPINPTEYEQQLNRRVEIRVIEN
ncbi:MAG: OmpA family protein [Bacteroidia bacterium]|nr:OmpA family protein [Bacteroidia bacterium]